VARGSSFLRARGGHRQCRLREHELDAARLAQSFAAGAIITMLADTMFPEAFEQGGNFVGVTTALGFATAFLLSRP